MIHFPSLNPSSLPLTTLIWIYKIREKINNYNESIQNNNRVLEQLTKEINENDRELEGLTKKAEERLTIISGRKFSISTWPHLLYALFDLQRSFYTLFPIAPLLSYQKIRIHSSTKVYTLNRIIILLSYFLMLESWQCKNCVRSGAVILCQRL